MKYYLIVRHLNAKGAEVDHTYTQDAEDVIAAVMATRTEFSAAFGTPPSKVRIVEIGEHPNGQGNPKVRAPRVEL